MRAVEHATASGDFGTFKKASAAERAGKPLPPVEVKKDAPIERVVSKRQQAINERIRTAVATATAEKDKEIAALKTPAPVAAAVPPPAAAAPAPTPTPAPPVVEKDWKYYVGLPTAPKLKDFDSVEEHAAAMSLFVNQTIAQEAREATATHQRNEAFKQDADRFTGSLQKAREADPELISKLPPEVLEAKPLRAFSFDDIKGGKVSFASFIAEVAFRSDDAARFLTYLGANRAEGDRILKLPAGQWIDALTRLDGRLSGSPTPSSSPSVPAPTPAAPTVLTDMPAPRATLGQRASVPTDPAMAAAKTGDMGAFRAAMRAKRLAASAKG